MESITKTKLSTEQIERIVQKSFGNSIHPVQVDEMKEGWFNTSYWIILSDGREVILKISPPPDIKVLRYEKDVIRVEVDVLRLFKETGKFPVPAVYSSDFSGTIISSDYFIMEKLPGTAYSKIKQSLTSSEREQIDLELGRINRAINDIEGMEFGLYIQHDKKRKRWSDAFMLMVDDILLDGLEQNVQLPLEYDQIRDVIISRLSVMDPVDKPCLVHWDLHDGNVIINDGKITGIIDCDRALWGDPLIEFYFSKFPERENFFKGYGPSLIDTKEGKCRRVLYNIYLDLVMVVESYYRKYTKEHMNWTYNLLQKEIDVLNNL